MKLEESIVELLLVVLLQLQQPDILSMTKSNFPKMWGIFHNQSKTISRI